jgi:hypothetical protein
MLALVDSPILLFIVAAGAQVAAAFAGEALRRRVRPPSDDERESFKLVQGSALTLIALLIGFTLSMAVGRYDQRHNLEEEEANAIGTEYLRVDFLPAADAAKIKELLRQYLDARIQFFSRRGPANAADDDSETTRLQDALWSAARGAAAAQPSPLTALSATGMNDVLNAQGYTQAAFWNRIPIAAWALMGVVALICNVLLGYGQSRMRVSWMLIVPLTLSTTFFLIADIDGPRTGVIRMPPVNLIALARSLKQ